MNMTEFKRIPALAEYLNNADHVDVKSRYGDISLQESVAGILSYQPRWFCALLRVRVWLLNFLGQDRQPILKNPSVTSENLPVEEGRKASFLTVADSDGETYWIGVAEESHLGMALGVVVESVDGQAHAKLFHLVTVVQYRNRAGMIYFNLIRPFHYLIVSASMRRVLPSG